MVERNRFNHKGVLGAMTGTGQVNDNIFFPPGAHLPNHVSSFLSSKSYSMHATFSEFIGASTCSGGHHLYFCGFSSL